MTRRLIVEADGGSRGNPGPAGYGAVVKDALTGEVLAEESESLGQTTNNVAEYSGLIAGLRAAARIAPGAAVEVRMDSKLVVEQMSGRWQIKHPGLRPLAAQAAQTTRSLGRVSYVWVPRARNAHADRLANEAMDAAERPGGGRGRTRSSARGRSGEEPAPPGPSRDSDRRAARAEVPGARSGEERAGAGRETSALTGAGGMTAKGPRTSMILLRHGETPLSAGRRFAGRGDIPLTDRGLAQARAAARRLAARGGVDAIVTSPLQRTRLTAEAIAEATGAPLVVDDAFVETDFGEWEGLSHAEAAERWPAEMAVWVADAAAAPPGGESFAAVTRRVLARLDALVAAYPDQTVVLVSHMTPMKVLLRHALLAPPAALRRMLLDVASLCEIDWYADGSGLVRSLNDTAHLWAREWAESALC